MTSLPDNTFGYNDLCVRVFKSIAFPSYPCPFGQSKELDLSYIPERENKSGYKCMHVEERKFAVPHLYRYPTWGGGLFGPTRFVIILSRTGGLLYEEEIAT